ncbi:aldehyde dehydrogenase family 3 member H1-like [Zingiber officinale]|uniref:aldehyde dehydrogenase family 3 member H1-like n=1 Tax=Zingiber officinale TaxID=94328 RepID=UPI001C4CCEB0|nr:aldehyde dehydrogenase family 3 member H1-like [Zingiber officinale]
MGSEYEGRSAAEVVAGMRERFASGKTRIFQWRVAQLKAIVRMIDEKEDEIAAAIYEDLAKSRTEACLQEIALAKDACLFTLKKLKHWVKPQKVSTSIITFPSTAQIVPEPFGVILIISAWNYPFLLSIEPVIGAIAAGNTVVLKPSEVAPSTSSFFAKVLPKYVDNSCIRVLEGSASETSELLEQKWDKIMYTGNPRVARIVMAAAAKHLTPVILELGGKCPLIVDSNIDLKVAAKRIVVGKWGSNSGQACIAPDYIITTKSFAAKLVDALKIALQKFYGKDPLQSTDLSRIVNIRHFARLRNLLEDEKVSGKIVYGGQQDEKDLKIAPTILLDVPCDALMMEEEIFGPLLPIVTVDDLGQSFDIINSKEKPLAAYLFTRDQRLEENFVKTVSAGGMLINDTILQFTNRHLPFGGVGESGMGFYHGKFSFDAFSHKKAVLRRCFIVEIPMRYPPYTPQKQKVVRGLMSGNVLPLLHALIRKTYLALRPPHSTSQFHLIGKDWSNHYE